MRYPHHHHVVASLDVPNEYGATIRIRVLGVYSRFRKQRWWLVRSYVEKDGSVEYRPGGHEPSTTVEAVKDRWIATLSELAWSKTAFQKRGSKVS
jgi:hypothetical protein